MNYVLIQQLMKTRIPGTTVLTTMYGSNKQIQKTEDLKYILSLILVRSNEINSSFQMQL